MSTHGVLVTMAGYPMVPSNFMPDNGLAQLAGCLVAEGHDVRIVDLNTPELTARLFPVRLRRRLRPLMEAKLAGALGPAEADALLAVERDLEAHQRAEFSAMGRELAELVKQLGAHWLGFKLWNGDGYSGSELMARAVKAELPDLPILGGGSHADFFSEYLPRIETPFDYFGVGEGEPTLTAFAAHVAGELPLERVPNLVYRGPLGPRRTSEARISDLDALPEPIYDDAVYPAATGAGKFRAAVVEETRGCPHRCAFCNHPVKAGHKLRVKGIGHVVAQLTQMKRDHGISAFKLGGSYTPSGYMRKLAAALLEADAGVTFCSYGRISDARRADFDLYYRAGCRALFFGVETGSQMLLDEQIDKGYQTEHAADVLRACKASGVFTIASLVYPNPGETEVSRQATLRLLEATRPDGVPVHFPLLLPGSTWWHQPERYGFMVPDRERYLATMLRYKARLLFPPRFWPEIPCQIDEKPFARYAEETAEMTRAIDELGCTTLISDDTALLGTHSGLGITEFRDRFRQHVALGDAEGEQALVDRVNEQLREDRRAPAVAAG